MTTQDSFLTLAANARMRPIMQNATSERSPGSIRILCEEAQNYGVTPEQCLAGTGLLTFHLYENDRSVTMEQELLAIANFLKHAPDQPGMGIRIGRRYQPEVFGIWGYAILSSPTVRAGLKTAIDFANLSFLIARLDLDESCDPPELNMEFGQLSKAVEAFVLERHLTAISNFAGRFLPKLSLSGATLKTTLDDPKMARLIQSELGMTVRLRCAHNSIVLSQRFLDMRLPHYDPITMENSLKQCRSLLPQEDAKLDSIVRRVHEATLVEMNNDPTILTISSKLGISERTLRRRLSDAGTSFREIRRDARLAIGHELLSTAGLDVSTVAWRTGYSEPSSFVRAFSKKYGYSPGSLKIDSRKKGRNA